MAKHTDVLVWFHVYESEHGYAIGKHPQYAVGCHTIVMFFNNL